jgi:adenylosuccinate synthase
MWCSIGLARVAWMGCGGGPFPTELMDSIGVRLASAATSMAPPRAGRIAAAAMKRSIQINGVTGLCVTKLDMISTGADREETIVRRHPFKSKLG